MLQKIWMGVVSAGLALVQEIKAWPQAYLFRRPLLLGLLSYAGVVLVVKASGALNQPSSADPAQWIGNRVAVTGVIIQTPDPRPRRCAYVIQTETLRVLRSRLSPTSVYGRLLVDVYGADDRFASPGDRIRFIGKMQKPKKARIPGTFDYQAYLQSKGIFSLVYTSTHSAENLGASQAFRFLKIGWRIRQRIVSIFQTHLPPEEAAVLSGLVVGNRPRFHPEIRRIFVESGTMHMLVASGSNVAFVVGLWYLLVRLMLRLRRRWALASALPVVWLYVLIVGADPPIVRAGVMATVGVLSYLLAREDRPYQALGGAALVLLLVQPRMLFDVGFQMSFTTVFGLIYWLPRWDPGWARLGFWRRWGLRLAAATATAQIWLFPITASVFKRFFPVGLVANVLILPLAAGGLVAGLALVAADTVVSGAPVLAPVLTVVQHGVHFYMHALIRGVAFFADTPGLSFWWSPPGPAWVVGFYLGCLSVADLSHKWTARLGLGIGVLLMIGSGVVAYRETQPPAYLRLSWLDVGSRLSVLIETPEGERVLINPGPAKAFDSTERILMPAFTHQRIQKLNAVVITRSAPHHTAGLTSLKKWMTLGEVHTEMKNKTIHLGELEIQGLAGSQRFQAETPLLIRYKDKKILLAHVLPLKTQKELVERGVTGLDLMQARFSGKVRWRDDFVSKVKPNRLVDTSSRTKGVSVEPPWKNRRVEQPHKKGLFRIHLNKMN